MSKRPAWHIEQRKVSDMKEFENNPRSLNKKGVEDLKKSIDKFGLAEPILCQPDGTVIGGHARLHVIKEEGELKKIDVYVPDRQLSDKEYIELNVRLNKNIAGEWDWNKLNDMADEVDLENWGFEEFGQEKPKIVEKDIEPYNKSHILISFPPELIGEVSDAIQGLTENTQIEIEQSTN